MPDTAQKTIRLGDLRAASVPLAVTYGGQTLTIHYRPYVMDAAFEDAFLGALTDAADRLAVNAAFRQYLAEVIAGWNVVDDADAPVPLDLRAIPGDILQGWYRDIRAHLSPN